MLHSVATVHDKVGHDPERITTRSHAVTPQPATPSVTPPGRSNGSKTEDGEDGGGPIMQTLSKKSPFGALLSRTLPTYKGPHKVGVFDIEVPVESPRNIGSFRVKGMKDQEPGFKLETVLFSVFYPAEDTETVRQKVVWFPRLSQTVNGFLKMARRTSWLYKTLAYPIAAAAIYGTTFPATPEAPLKKPPEEGQQWPLLIFSHGVGCSRLMYSSICGEFASRGYIVCAIEHRDGTGPSSAIKLKDGTMRDVDFLNWTDIEWPNLPHDDQPRDDTTLRHDQLDMRVAEVEEVVRTMTKISKGEEIVETSLRSPQFDWKRWGPDWNALNVKRPIMTGHSLGGSAALLAASRKDRFDFRSVVAYDPAIQRLEPWQGQIPCPLLCINSEEFTRSDDFARLQNLAKTAPNPPIYSVAGSTHPSFSDVFLIVPGFINRRTGLKVDADEMLDKTMEITMAFLTGHCGGVSQLDCEEAALIFGTGDTPANASSDSLRNVSRSSTPVSMSRSVTPNGGSNPFRTATWKTNRSTRSTRSRGTLVNEMDGPICSKTCFGQPGDINWHPNLSDEQLDAIQHHTPVQGHSQGQAPQRSRSSSKYDVHRMSPLATEQVSESSEKELS